MCDKITFVHGGDDNVRRDKAQNLRWMYDDIRMKEGENVTQYVNWIKEDVTAIKSTRGVISDSEIVTKVLRTLLPIYAINVSSIEEVRAMLGNVLIV